MEYNDFLDSVVECINDTIDDDVDVFINTITKNNSLKLKGLCFRKRGINASPTIYMEHYYDMYVNGTDIDDISKRVIDVYLDSALKDDVTIDFYNDYEKVKNHIFFKLIKQNSNVELLKETPFVPFYDLAIVPYCEIKNKQFGNASIMIKNSHVKMWKCSSKDIISQAFSNMQNHMKFEILPMHEMLMDMDCDISIAKECMQEDTFMYVVTNKDKYYGASVMALSQKLDEFSNIIGGDYYILPSSIHEIILLKANGDEDICNMNNMIQEINSTSVGVTEVLSNHAYIYICDEKKIISL